MNNILALAHEVLKGNQQALAELNDIFEENELERQDIKRYVIRDMNCTGEGRLVLVLPKSAEFAFDLPAPYRDNIEIVDVKTEDDVADLVYLEFYSNDAEFAIKIRKYVSVCNMLDIKIKKIRNPAVWGFVAGITDDLIAAFTLICIEPIENWWRNHAELQS